MSPPGSSLERPPAENLQHSQVKMNSAQTAKQRGSVWLLGSWNVRPLLDCKGSVETARQCTDAHVGQFDEESIES